MQKFALIGLWIVIFVMLLLNLASIFASQVLSHIFNWGDILILDISVIYSACNHLAEAKDDTGNEPTP